MTNEKIVYYTAVGARDTPDEYLALMIQIGQMMANKGYIMRSGGAPGADSAFEIGCDRARGKKEIFLPYKNFNKNASTLFNTNPRAFEIAKRFHPAGEALSGTSLKFHGRNVHQVLGKDLETRSEFLICWTFKAQFIGGTATAMSIARDNGIPIINLAKCKPDIDSFNRLFEREIRLTYGIYG